MDNTSIIDLNKTAAGRKLKKRLNEESTLSTLEHLLTRMDELEKSIDHLSKLIDRTPGLMAMAGDVFDEQMQRVNAQGLNVEALVKLIEVNGLALSAASKEPTLKIGFWGSLRSLRDPDRQKSMGFLLKYLKELGKRL